MIAFSVVLRALRNPLALLIGAFVGFMLPRFWLEPPQGRPAQRLQQAAAGHDHAHRQRPAGRLVVPAGHRAGRPGDPAADLDRVRARHPGGQPGPAVRPGAGEHGPAGPLGRPGADGDRHLDPAHGRRQPGRDPRLDRLHDPRAGPHQGRDPDPDGPAADVRLRRRVPADRPVGLPLRHRAVIHRADVRPGSEHPRHPGRHVHHRARRRSRCSSASSSSAASSTSRSDR